MKKLLLSLTLLIFCAFSYAQTSFDTQIKKKSESLKIAQTTNECENLFNEFSSMTTSSDANRWKAYYFAGFSSYKKVEILLKQGKKGNLADSNAIAYKFAIGALSTQPKNTDVLSLLNLIAQQKKAIAK